MMQGLGPLISRCRCRRQGVAEIRNPISRNVADGRCKTSCASSQGYATYFVIVGWVSGRSEFIGYIIGVGPPEVGCLALLYSP